MAYKHCSKSYRIIDGLRFEQWTDDESLFQQEIAKFKAEGRRYRIIQGRLFREVIA